MIHVGSIVNLKGLRKVVQGLRHKSVLFIGFRAQFLNFSY